MVAVINTGHSVRSIFYYNETKVLEGKAACIGEGNYPVAVENLSVDLKLKLFLKQLELNENAKRNSVHISLNFDPSETALATEKLMEIAKMYMEKIGFGSQPYLVYQHYDAGHPHIHIVSIKVQADGRRIDMHNIGKNKSETARKEIETTFNLVRAESKNSKAKLNIQPVNIQKVQYGSLDSKKAISGILNAVIPNYKYTTIGELNAILNLYNITAEQGKEGSKMFLHKGLVYRIQDYNKKPVGVPIKASSFYLQPTLKNLEIKFASNKAARIPHLKKIRNTIDLAFLKNSKIALNDLQNILFKEGISVVYRKNEQGLLYGVTYVDHTTKCVFNGSVLGTAYAAKGIQQRCGIDSVSSKSLSPVTPKEIVISKSKKYMTSFISESELKKIIDSIVQPEYTENYISNQLKGKRKKRKRKGQSDN
ncbi:relaxase/mobilization nuclease domain-containing protein [Flavobacterium aquidurense]|uniref:relaxase/mobilization nuclease domain-containing protein n=1 Tax=Flavobacterium aquidurense TaxID=362413 RepID=UPI0028658D00|nr:relaxase/mobilization nuclease domain-containing protein [Flavobacterium aquidurense]MDR7371072.1 hypothetical protein [Flavobacterium aquidurense]